MLRNGIGDSLMVGPQFYSPRPYGAQIVQRGPHGAPLSQGDFYQPGKGFRFWRESLDAGAYHTPRTVYEGLLGLGGSKQEAPEDFKKNASKNAKSLAVRSETVSQALSYPLTAEARGLLAALDSYLPWQAHNGWFSSWASSQEIRAQLQIAIQNSTRASAGEAGRKQAIEKDPSFGSVYWGELKSRADEFGRNVSEAALRTERSITDAGKSPLTTAAMIGVGVAVLVAVSSYAGSRK